jgi:hypothetical protein
MKIEGFGTELWQPTSWFRILKPDGSLWMETSDRREAINEVKKTGWPLERLFRLEQEQWRTLDNLPAIKARNRKKRKDGQ